MEEEEKLIDKEMDIKYFVVIIFLELMGSGL